MASRLPVQINNLTDTQVCQTNEKAGEYTPLLESLEILKKERVKVSTSHQTGTPSSKNSTTQHQCGLRGIKHRQERLKHHKLTVLGHNTTELSNLLVYNIRKLDGKSKKPFTPSQREAFEELENFPEKYDLGSRQPDNLDLLKAWLLLFDKLFFFGSLHKYARFEVLPKNKGLKDLHGYCESHRVGKSRKTFDYDRDMPWAKIVLKSNNAFVNSPMDQLQTYLETLLHEMVHASFNIYVCCCISCWDKVKKNEGQSGHGIGWLKVWKAIDYYITVLNIGRCKFDMSRDFDYMLDDSIIEEIFARLAKNTESELVKNRFKYAFRHARTDLGLQVNNWTPEMEKVVGITKAEMKELGLDLHALGKAVAFGFSEYRTTFRVLRALRSTGAPFSALRDFFRKFNVAEAVTGSKVGHGGNH